MSGALLFTVIAARERERAASTEGGIIVGRAAHQGTPNRQTERIFATREKIFFSRRTRAERPNTLHEHRPVQAWKTAAIARV